MKKVEKQIMQHKCQEENCKTEALLQVSNQIDNSSLPI